MAWKNTDWLIKNTIIIIAADFFEKMLAKDKITIHHPAVHLAQTDKIVQ